MIETERTSERMRERERERGREGEKEGEREREREGGRKGMCVWWRGRDCESMFMSYILPQAYSHGSACT